MKARSGFFGVAMLLATVSAKAEIAPATTLFDPARHMHTSEVKPGMTGYGLSVFSGTKIEKFDVEVISVLKNQMGPKHNVVLIRCKGQGLEHSGAVEGMSGSPIYLKDDKGNYRMIGAFALGWQYNKDPIAGVRPIEEMLDVPTEAGKNPPKTVDLSGEGAGNGVTRWNAASLITRWQHPSTVADKPKNLSRLPMQLRPLATPLSVGGVDSSFFDQVAPVWQRMGLMPLQASSSGSSDSADADAKLEPGAAIALPVVSGDLDLSAIGTVTEVLGDKLWAFGHEYNAEGGVDLPMGVGHIDTIIASDQISFKMGSLVKLYGAIHNDEATGIAGVIGKVPDTIPIDVTVRTGQRSAQQTYHFEAIKHPKMTPMGISTALASAVQGHSNLPGEFTIHYTMHMQFDDGQSISVNNTATSATQAAELQRDLALPLTLAVENPFARAYPTKVTADFTVEPAAHVSVIRSVVADKSIYKPGDTAQLYVTTVNWKAGESTRTIELKFPDELPDGEYQLTVGDADRFLGDEVRNEPYRFEAKSIADVFGLIKQITDRPTTRLYSRLTADNAGISVGRTPLNGLPPSRMKMLALQNAPDVMPYVQSLSQETDWGQPLSGSTDLAITIAADPSKAQRPKPLIGMPAPEAQPPQQQQPQQQKPADNGGDGGDGGN